MQIGKVYQEAELKLRAQSDSVESSSIEAYCLVSFIINKDKAFLLTYPEFEISQEDYDKIMSLVQRRLDGEPIAYIIGKREFWTLDLKVTPDTLIPRPDTETLVENALVEAQNLIDSGIPQDKLRILDLGTGTGAIALALKYELKDAQIDAVDYSEKACNVAKENSQRLNLPINVINSDWFKELKPQHQYHIIVSNPPYIMEKDPHLAIGDLRYEPKTALVAPMNGFLDIITILRDAGKFLHNNGSLLIEHGYNQGVDVRAYFAKADFSAIETIRDLGNNERVTKGKFIYK